VVEESKLPQAMRPSGRAGRIFGWLMGRLNRKAYRWTVEQLRPAAPRNMLEIGFGTGHLLALAAGSLKLARVAGVDPSELMVETAAKRLRRFRKKIEIDLKHGDDASIAAGGSFDAIVALHSFQFWPHPAPTLTHLRSLLSPGGRFVLVLRLHPSPRSRKGLPNPLSHGADEIAAACRAAQVAGFVILAMSGISKSSHGIVLGCG
jgi:SAM-dependent methyltransferase